MMKSKITYYNVKSAGIFANEHESANENTIKVLKEENIELGHRAQMVTDELLGWADVVLTMTSQHKNHLLLQNATYQHKYFTLIEYVNKESKDDDQTRINIADPFV